MRNHRENKRKIQWLFVLLLFLFTTACAPNIERLKKQGDVDGLIEIIESDWKQNNDDRYDAAIALGELGDKKAIKPLIESLRYDRGFSINGVSYNDVIKESLLILGENNPEEIIDYLSESGVYKGVYSGDSERADDIKEVLIEIGSAVVEPFIAAVNENGAMEEYALEIFSEIGSSIKPILEEAYKIDPESYFIKKALNDASGYRSVEAAAEAVCQGRTIPGAAAFDPSAEAYQGVYIVGAGEKWDADFSNDVIWDAYSADLARQTETLQVVFCFDFKEAILIETCSYYLAPDIDRYQNVYNVSIVRATTGEIIAEKEFTSDLPRECQETEPVSLTVLNGDLDFGQIIEWLNECIQ